MRGLNSGRGSVLSKDTSKQTVQPKVNKRADASSELKGKGTGEASPVDESSPGTKIKGADKTSTSKDSRVSHLSF